MRKQFAAFWDNKEGIQHELCVVQLCFVIHLLEIPFLDRHARRFAWAGPSSCSLLDWLLSSLGRGEKRHGFKTLASKPWNQNL